MDIPMLPAWFNPHGFKLSLGDYPICHVTYKNEVMIGSNVARLQIRPNTVNQGKYQVLWLINHECGEFVRGQVQLTKHELEEAFNLCPDPPRNIFSASIGVDVGIQGHYVRKGRWLNVPAPGNGFDGDPNISVFVSDEIREAVLRLIDSPQ